MILEEATKEAYGYYASELTHGSNKSILAACDECGIVRGTTKNSYHNLCNVCARKGSYNPNWRGGAVMCTCQQCGKIFDVRQSNIKRGQGKYCSILCHAKAQKGENNPVWRGGISFEPYCVKFNNAFKDYIRAKFRYSCFLCKKTTEDNGRALDVHHVNYNKNCGCDETKCICVPLCIGCHSKTNYNRDYWQKLITDKLHSMIIGWDV